MKKSLKYGLLLMLATTLILFSCSEDKEPGSETGGPDPLAWDYGESWMEIEKRIDTEDWQTIDRGDTLEISFNYTDASKRDLIGIYGYNNPIDLNVDLDSIGDVKIEENDISFIFPLSLATEMDRETINLPIQITQDKNDTLLIIRNILSTPIIEVKYKKVAFREYPY